MLVCSAVFWQLGAVCDVIFLTAVKKITLKSCLGQKLWPFKVAKFESKDFGNFERCYHLPNQNLLKPKSCIANMRVLRFSLRVTKNILEQ